MGPNDVVQYLSAMWKAGGWLVLVCAAIGGLIQWQRAPLQECLGGYSTDYVTGDLYCSTVEIFDSHALLTLFGAILVGGFIGLVAARIFIKAGVRHDTLGVDPDA